MSNARTFVKVYDNLLDHPAWMDLDPVHVGVWVLALGYCRRNKTYGHLPVRALTRDGATEADVDALVAAGRLHRAGHECEDCPQPAEGQVYVHAYTEHQNSPERDAELSAKRAEAGRKGGAARVAKQSAEQVAKQTGSRNKQVQAEREREQKEKDSPARARAAAFAADFETWWETYPHKVGKTAAAKAYEKARRTAGVDADTLMAGLANATAVWVAERRERQFIPHPATWLNQGRWDDDVAPLPGMPDAAHKPATLMQCSLQDPHGRHETEDAARRYVCMGVEA